MAWIKFNNKKPEDGDYVLIKFSDGVVKLGIFMKGYRDKKGRFASNGFFNEDTCDVHTECEEWAYIPN